MKNPVLETLFLPISSGVIPAQGRALFLNAQMCAGLDDFAAIDCQQVFKPAAAGLEAHGFAVNEALGAEYDVALVLASKNMVEARYLIAKALGALAEGGVLIVAAANDAGGGRLEKLLAATGVQNVQALSKNKARVVWGAKESVDQQWIAESLVAGEVQDVTMGAHTYSTQPGIFGWNKTDRGSALLAERFPAEFHGAGADFGCGYGYLSQHVSGAKLLWLIDADLRAVQLAERNVTGAIKSLWADLTLKNDIPQRLDFIVMNPPFHSGKKTDSDIGVSFIETAAQSLRKGGKLWMVANAHLPYEMALQQRFSSVEKLFERDGFKGYLAVR